MGSTTTTCANVTADAKQRSRTTREKKRFAFWHKPGSNWRQEATLSMTQLGKFLWDSGNWTGPEYGVPFGKHCQKYAAEMYDQADLWSVAIDQKLVQVIHSVIYRQNGPGPAPEAPHEPVEPQDPRKPPGDMTIGPMHPNALE